MGSAFRVVDESDDVASIDHRETALEFGLTTDFLGPPARARVENCLPTWRTLPDREDLRPAQEQLAQRCMWSDLHGQVLLGGEHRLGGPNPGIGRRSVR